ncbi:MAG: hypothetical protein PHT69_14835 [Bacteroidales bacterium]|nr:hypothetical protein [Bacteroidales bacterium]
MQALTQKQLKEIYEVVTNEGISFSHLREELADHICCIIESEMQQGLTFEEAFEKTLKQIGSKAIKRVQEDTLLLIDKNYRIMKKSMKTIGLVSLVLITIGALFKIQHWPGAGILLTIGFFFIGAVFMPSALWVMKKESKLKGNILIYIVSILGSFPFVFGFLFKIQHWPGANILIIMGFSIIGLLLIPAILISKLRNNEEKNLHPTYIIGAVSLIFYLFGELFKIMHWPGAAIMLILGAIGLTTVFFPMYVIKVYKKADSIKSSFLFLCIGIVFFNMFNLLLALNVSKNVLSYFIKPGNERIKMTQFLEKRNNLLVENLLNDTLNTDSISIAKINKVKDIADSLCILIENVKIDVISQVDDINFNEAATKAKNPALILNKNNFSTPTFILCGFEEDSLSGKATLIKNEIEAFRGKLLDLCEDDENAKKIILNALHTDSVLLVDEKAISWEMGNFYHLVTIAAINKLSYLQRNVRIAECEALEHFKKKQPCV